MSVPPFVPPNVPAADGAPARRSRARKTTTREVGAASYVSRTDAGWRFQMRLPANFLGGDFRLAGAPHIVRANLGPRRRGEAKRLGQQLATLCQAICAAAAAGKDDTMAQQPLSDDQPDLVKQVVAACQNAISRAIAQPSQAIGLARGLDAALTSLRLVQAEVAKGEAGASVVTAHADALTRHALTEVLKLSSQPAAALTALAAVARVAPAPPQGELKGAATPTEDESKLPTFSKVSQDYIDMRIGRDGANHADISTLQLRRQTFIDVMGDRPIDRYRPSDLQTYVNRMQFWPANVRKRGDIGDKTTLEILETNKSLTIKPMALKTMQDGYVANVRTMARHGMTDLGYRDPFGGAKISWPAILRRPTPREGIGIDVLNRVFRDGAASGQMDEAMMPLLSVLTSRRIGLLVFLLGSDIRKKNGVWVAQTSGIVQIDGQWRRVPVKTSESMTFFVLHDFLVEIGWVDWAREQEGWLFAAAHEHPDPAKYESKAMNRLLKRNGAGGQGEVFHSLRGDAIDEMRKAKVDARARRLQAGHELADVHDMYGFRALNPDECQRLATLPLPEGIDRSVFKGLDFDKLAAGRRGRGRPPGGGR